MPKAYPGEFRRRAVELAREGTKSPSWRRWLLRITDVCHGLPDRVGQMLFMQVWADLAFQIGRPIRTVIGLRRRGRLHHASPFPTPSLLEQGRCRVKAEERSVP